MWGGGEGGSDPLQPASPSHSISLSGVARGVARGGRGHPPLRLGHPIGHPCKTAPRQKSRPATPVQNHDQHPPSPSTIATSNSRPKSRSAPPVNNRDHHPLSKIASSTPPPPPRQQSRPPSLDKKSRVAPPSPRQKSRVAPPVNNLVATSSLYLAPSWPPHRKIPGYATDLSLSLSLKQKTLAMKFFLLFFCIKEEFIANKLFYFIFIPKL